MSRRLARIAIYCLLAIPLIVIGILISRQIQYDLALRRDFIEGNKLQFSALNTQQIMAASELSTRSFFLIFACFLMILCGLLITFRGTENAFNLSKEFKVRYSLRTAYPGVAMAVFGCLLLAYSIYKSSRLQQAATNQILGITSTQPKDAIASGRDIIVFEPQADTMTRALIADDDVAPIIADTTVRPANETIPQTSKLKTTQASNTEVATSQMVEPAVLNISPADVRWANQLAARCIAYGYAPSRSDDRRYDQIMRSLDKRNNGLRINSELKWAFDLLRRTKNGYQPSGQELQRYETAITQQLRGNKVAIEETKL